MKNIYFIITITAIFILMISLPVSAGEWRGEGTPLYTIAQGRIHGGVFVEGGHGYTMENPYVEYFDLPKDIEYARLYVPMWNYNEDDWLEVSINDEKLGKRSEPDYVGAWGVANYAFTVTDKVSPGMNRVSVTYHNTNGAPYSIVLVAVYEDQALPQTQFWITEGNHVLADSTKTDIGKVDFNGDIPTGASDATLWTMIIAGTKGENDKLYFNSHLLGTDVGSAKSGAYYDLDRWDVTKLLNTANNTVVFERGDEAYIHPMFAVLAVCCEDGQEEDYLKINSQAQSTGRSVPIAVIAVFVVSVIFFAYRVVGKR